MAEFIFTFGNGQISPISGRSQGRYGEMRFIRIEAPDFLAARARMIELYGMEWSMQYEVGEEPDAGGVEEFGLVEIIVVETATIGGPRRLEFDVRPYGLTV